MGKNPISIRFSTQELLGLILNVNNFDGFGSEVWEILAGCGWLWLVLGGFGWFSVVVGGLGLFLVLVCTVRNQSFNKIRSGKFTFN